MALETVYEATAYAVPFLIELANTPPTPDRSEILSYLGTLADGSSYIDAHKDIIPFTPDEMNELHTELEWVKQKRQAVKKGEDLYLGLLSSDDQNTCISTAYILSRFPEEKYWTAFQKRYKQATNNDHIRCGIAILSQIFAQKSTINIVWLRQTFEQETSLPIRIALAVSLVYADSGNSIVLNFLKDCMLSNDEIDEAYRIATWDVGEPVQHIIEALFHSKEGSYLAISHFNELLSQGSSSDRLAYCYHVLQCVLREGETFIIDPKPKPLALPE